MKPFFLYLGGKHRMAARYGPPQRRHVIEPFAGSAGYSCFWEPRQVTLIEKDERVYGLWRYLSKASAREIMRLPSRVSHLDDLPRGVCEEAKALIGFWLNTARAPVLAVERSKWSRMPQRAPYSWGETVKLRIASQLEKIRHWKIIHGSYESAPEKLDAHWHVDPPYAQAKLHHHYGCGVVDYAALAEWCLSRRGFLQVCENGNADWLPFEPFRLVSSPRQKRGFAVEAVFELETA